MPRQWQWSNSRWWQHGSWRHWHSSPSYTQKEWGKADERGQTTSPSASDVPSSVSWVASAPTRQQISSREPDALPVKERAARVEQQHRSFAGIEKQQAERVAVLEEQVAAKKLRLQKTKLNIQQAQQETDRIALLVAAQTAADELGRPSSRRIHGQRAGGPRYRTYGGKISRAPSRDDDADPSIAGRQCLPHCLQEDQPQDFHTRLAEFWPTRQTTQCGGTSDATDHLEWRALSGPVPLALAEICDPPEPLPAPFPDCKLWKTRSPFCHDSSALA